MAMTLTGLLFMQPDITTWSGAVKFDQERGDQIPRSLVSNGTLRLVPQSDIAAPQSIRAALRRLGLDLGFPCMGFAAISVSDAAELVRQIEQQRERFDAAVEEIVAKLPQLYAEQCDRFPEHERLIQTHRLDPNAVRSAYRFGVLTTELKVPSQSDAQRLFDAASTTVLPGLLQAVATRAQEIVVRMANAQDTGTQRVLRATRRLVDKLGRFSMVDPRCAPASAAYTTALQGMPGVGDLDPVQSFVLRQVLLQLADPAGILEHGALALKQPSRVSVATQPSLVLPTMPPTPSSVTDMGQADIADDASEPACHAPIPTQPSEQSRWVVF